jgi:hypothetical protein
MRSVRKITTIAVAFAAVLTCLGACSGVARADSVTYTFTGSGVFVGTAFTYVSASGFISSPTGNLTVSPSGVLNAPTLLFPPTPQPLTSFGVEPDTSIPSLEVLTFNEAAENIPILPITLSSFGSEQISSPSNQVNGVFGTLVITPTAAPEPSSLAMLLLGLLGIAFLVMKKNTPKSFRPAKRTA